MLWEECGSAGALTKTPLIKITRKNLGFTCNCIFSNSQSCFRIVSYVVVSFSQPVFCLHTSRSLLEVVLRSFSLQSQRRGVPHVRVASRPIGALRRFNGRKDTSL